MSTRILAIDTATEACSVAVWNQGEIHALFELCPREHTQRILPMVQQVLAESGLALNQLDALAFGRGPGSFTGVRIGIGIAQGLALGADLPMIGVSTLQTMAQGAWRVSGAERVLAAIDARMGEVYWGQFERQADGRWLESEGEAVLSPAQALERNRLSIDGIAVSDRMIAEALDDFGQQRRRPGGARGLGCVSTPIGHLKTVEVRNQPEFGKVGNTYGETGIA